MKQSKITVWSSLLWMFLKVNLLSPSGPASVGLLYKEAVGKIMTEEQFVEAVGFSNVLPGSEALKLAMFVGFAAGGVPGVLTALLGAVLPPTVMMLAVAFLLQQFQQEDWLQGFVKGMSPAIAALIHALGWRGALGVMAAVGSTMEPPAVRRPGNASGPWAESSPRRSAASTFSMSRRWSFSNVADISSPRR